MMGFEEILNYKLNAHGGSNPGAVPPPKYDKPRTGNTVIILQRRGGPWGTGTVHSIYNYSGFIKKTRFPFENRTIQI